MSDNPPIDGCACQQCEEVRLASEQDALKAELGETATIAALRAALKEACVIANAERDWPRDPTSGRFTPSQEQLTRFLRIVELARIAEET